jgi:hypothetical protein
MTIIYPLLICGALAVAGSGLLYIFVLDVKMKTLARKSRQQREQLEGRVAQVAEAAELLKAQLAEMERPQRASAQALNLNKRGQILRMRRRGERPESIAGALSIPRNEVELLLKVHDLSLECAEEGAVAGAPLGRM